MKNNPHVRVGIIGLGYWGPKLLRNFSGLAQVEVSACADLDRTKREKIRLYHPGAYFTDDFRDLVQRELDAVVIATPPATHYQIAWAALTAGKHVFVEKPLTTKYREAQYLVQVAKKKKRVLMVDHVFLYSPPVQLMKTLIKSGTLGTINYFDSMRVNLGVFQSDTNVLWDLACHDLSILEYLIPERPVRIACFASSHMKSRLEDIAYITLKYRSDFIAHININWLAPTKIRRIIIGGSKKMVVYDEGNVEEKIKIYDKGVLIRPRLKYAARVNYRVGDVVAPYVSADEPLARVTRHFIDCILTKRTPLSDGTAGAHVVKLLEKAELSLKTDRMISLTP